MRAPPLQILVLFVLLAGPVPAQVSDAATLTYAYGANWQSGQAQRDMLIFEFVNEWHYGDDYVYLETSNLATARDAATSVATGETTLYAEVHARLSLSKLVGAAVVAGPIRDVLLANQVDASQGDVVLLTGAGIIWGSRGKTWLQTDVFVRHDPSLTRATWQAVAYSAWPFVIGPARFAYGGYIKFVGPEPPNAAFMISDTRLLWWPTAHLRTGVALRAWRNDSGVRGINQVVPELVAQWVF